MVAFCHEWRPANLWITILGRPVKYLKEGVHNACVAQILQETSTQDFENIPVNGSLQLYPLYM